MLAGKLQFPCLVDLTNPHSNCVTHEPVALTFRCKLAKGFLPGRPDKQDGSHESNNPLKSLTAQRDVSQPQHPRHSEDRPAGRCQRPDTQPCTHVSRGIGL